MRTLIAAVLLLAFLATGGSGQPDKKGGDKKKFAPGQPPVQLEEEIARMRDQVREVEKRLDARRAEIQAKYRRMMEEELKDAEENAVRERAKLAARMEQIENI